MISASILVLHKYILIYLSSLVDIHIDSIRNRRVSTWVTKEQENILYEICKYFQYLENKDGNPKKNKITRDKITHMFVLELISAWKELKKDIPDNVRKELGI